MLSAARRPITRISSSVGTSLWSIPRSPMAKTRSGAWGTWAAMPMACDDASSASRYSGNDSHCQLSPSSSTTAGMSSTPSMRATVQARSSDLTGANPTPQLPITTVVTPWAAEVSRRGSQRLCPS